MQPEAAACRVQAALEFDPGLTGFALFLMQSGLGDCVATANGDALPVPFRID